MTPRQRVLSVLQGRKPDVVPWFGDLDYWASALFHTGRKPEGFQGTAAYLDWHRELKVGFYLQGYFPFRSAIENCRESRWSEGHDNFHQIETPLGTLRECWRYLPQSFSGAPVEHLVKSAADLPAYAYIHAHTCHEANYDFAQTRLGQIGDAGILLCYLPKSPLMQLIALDAGVMTVTEMFCDAREELEATLAAVRRSHDAAAAIALESPADVLMIPENLSSECVGPQWYELYMRDYLEHWATRINAAGKYSCIHMDGTLRGLLRQVCATPLTFIEALTPAPVGDLSVEQWAQWSGNDQTVLWGGLPGGYFTDKVSDAEFDRFVKHVLSVMRSEPRFVLGVGDQVPPDALEYRVTRVADLVEEYGRC